MFSGMARGKERQHRNCESVTLTLQECNLVVTSGMLFTFRISGVTHKVAARYCTDHPSQSVQEPVARVLGVSNLLRAPAHPISPSPSHGDPPRCGA
jgi:hypothetical protein